MNHHDRPRQDQYGDEIQQDYYPLDGYSAQRLPYPNAAAAQLEIHQQNAMLAQLSRVNRNGIPQYAEENIRYYARMQQNDFNNMEQPIYHRQPQRLQEEADHRHMKQQEACDDKNRLMRPQETRDEKNYAELYEEVFAPHSRTTISGNLTSTERTGPRQTSTSSATSRYGSSTTTSFESEDVNWEDNIMSALNDMAGNLKKIGGIHCNQAGPDSTEVQLKLNLPFPMEHVDMDVKEGFNNAMASLSPKKCGNMKYEYSHLDEHVIDMEERFLGTMDQIQGNMMPVYKSLFQSQSESSDDDDDDDELEEDQSQSTYEDPRFLPKVSPNLQQQRYETVDVVRSPLTAQNIDGIPSQIIVSNEPSGVSSAGSWKLLSPREEQIEFSNRDTANNIIKTINNNLDVAVHTSKLLSNENEGTRRNEQWVHATKHTLEVENPETAVMEMKAKPKTRDSKSVTEIPHVIDVKNGENVPECYSDLTMGVQMSTQACTEKDKSTSHIPTIRTHFSGDEIMGCRKASFQRNSIKKGNAFNPGLNDLAESADVFAMSDPPQSHTRSKSIDAPEVLRMDEDECKVEEGPDDELVDNCRDEEQEEKQQHNEEREEAKKLDEERKQLEQLEAEAKAAQEALEAKRLEDRVEEELKAARKALKARKLKEERKRLEAEANAAEEAFKEMKLEEEKIHREAEAKAAKEAEKAKKLEEERKRFEAEAKAAQEALEAKALEGERKQRETEEKAAEEARKAKMEEERKRIEAETKAAQEALDLLYAKKMDEERRQREAKKKKFNEERMQYEAKAKAIEAKKLKKVRERVEAETKAAEKEAKKLEGGGKQEAKTKAIEKALKSEKERKRIEAETKADPDEKERASLYKVQGFDDYCKSIVSTQINIDDDISKNTQNNIVDTSDQDSRSVEELESDGNSEVNQQSLPSHEEEYSTGTMSFDERSNSSNSVDTYSNDEESDIFTDTTSSVEDSDSTSDVRSTSTTEKLRNRNHLFSSEETVNTMDKTVQSFLTKDSSRLSARSSKSFSKSKFARKAPKLSSYTSDEPIPIAATMSTLQTFDQGTVHSGQHSLGRFIKSSDESVVSSSSYSHQSVVSVKPIALPVIALPREIKKKCKIETESRSSILGRIVSFTLSLVLRIIFTIILFSYTWIKHIVITIGKKRATKIDCTPTQFALQPDQSIRREEIQDRITDSRIHHNAIQQQYLGYEDPQPHQEHYTTTMIMKPPALSGYLVDDSDEVGTCVESIVPDAHYPNLSDGKMSTWKITQKNTEMSSLSSPPSTSFRVLKSAYSALSSTKRESEQSNWMDQPTIDDEMSYYE